jgi:8-oxo-dGTP diphosphatase
MNILAHIREQDIFPDAASVDVSGFSRRRAVRTVLLNERGEIALLFVSKYNYHKLPGGGIEPDETLQAALSREVFEEIGCAIEVTAELGTVIEYRDKWRQVQTSHCYLARRTGKQGQSSLTAEEYAAGFEVMWAKDIDHAICILAADDPAGYDGKRIRYRDLIILRAAACLPSGL